MSGRLHLVDSAAATSTQAVWTLLDRPVQLPLDRTRAEPDLGVSEDLEEHLDRLGHRPGATGRHGDALIETLDEIALTGRGGGHFPAARKWLTVLRAGGGGTVVANAAEGEPASGKDAALVTRRPHLVLDGLVSAGEAVGASDLVVWLHAGDHAAHRAMTRALGEREAAGFAEAGVRIVPAPDHYLAGESSAILRSLAGGPALPQFRRTPAAVDGLHGRPALVHNVETLARVALAARLGSGGYRPTTLLTVVTGDRRTVVEAEPSWSLSDALTAAGQGATDDVGALLLGGYGGAWLPWSQAAGLAVHEPSARAAGISLGAGVVAPLPREACGLTYTAAIAGYLASSSARQCGPCLFGLPAIAGVVALLVTGQAGRADLRRLDRFTAQVAGRGGCHHPDGAVRLVLSALSVFASDVDAHRRGRPCPAATNRVLFPLPAMP